VCHTVYHTLHTTGRITNAESRNTVSHLADKGGNTRAPEPLCSFLSVPSHLVKPTHRAGDRVGTDGQEIGIDLARFLLQGQRRSKQFHTMRTPQFGILRRHGIGFGYRAEECFHGSCGREGDQDSTGCVANERPDMGHSSRRQQRIAGSQFSPLACNLDDELAF
jgi:hypothetical protein